MNNKTSFRWGNQRLGGWSTNRNQRRGGGPTTGVGLQAEAEGIIAAATSIETDWEMGPLESVHVLNVPGLISEGETAGAQTKLAASFAVLACLPFCLFHVAVLASPQQ